MAKTEIKTAPVKITMTARADAPPVGGRDLGKYPNLVHTVVDGEHVVATSDFRIPVQKIVSAFADRSDAKAIASRFGVSEDAVHDAVQYAVAVGMAEAGKA